MDFTVEGSFSTIIRLISVIHKKALIKHQS